MILEMNFDGRLKTHFLNGASALISFADGGIRWTNLTGSNDMPGT